MQLIETALAFAVTMLVLSILCSTLVETIHRIFGMREAGFRKMLGEFYDRVLAPKLTVAAADVVRERWQFQRRMAGMRSPVGLADSEKAPDYPTNPLKIAYDWLATIWRGRGISELTTTGFMEKLGTDPVGKAFAAALAAAPAGGGAAPAAHVVDQALQDVAQKFEAFSKDATTFFARRARLLSVCVAMFVAVALHVDAIDLFQSLLNNSDARAAVLAMQDEALKANKRMEEQVAAATKNPNAPPANLAELTAAYAETQKKMQETQAKLQATGAAIGWSAKRWNDARPYTLYERPGCVDAKEQRAELTDGKCVPPNEAQLNIWLGWPTNVPLLIGLALGGLLIGLGGPFWSDAISNITRVRDVARTVPGLATPTTVIVPSPGGAGAAAPAAVVVPGAGGPAGHAPTAQPHTPVDAFKVAAR